MGLKITLKPKWGQKFGKFIINWIKGVQIKLFTEFVRIIANYEGTTNISIKNLTLFKIREVEQDDQIADADRCRETANDFL